jgi:di/tricarboxylate transporter
LMVLLTLFNVMPLIAAVGLAAISLILTRCITPREASQTIDYRVLITIACAFGITNAMKNSGLAGFLAENIVKLSSEFGVFGILATIYIITSFYNLIITSNAAAAFLFPVAFNAATALALDPRPFVITVMIAAAASFASPISYQTNLMVYGPGGYKYLDFFKIGMPLQILVGSIAIMLIEYFYL